MATVVPPPSKRQKLAAENLKQDEEERQKIPEGLGSVRVQFVDSASGQTTGAPLSVPVAQATVKNLELLLNALQGQDDKDRERIPYRFTFHPTPSTEAAQAQQQNQPLDIENNVYHSLLAPLNISTEFLLTLHYTPLSVFRVRAVSRLSASIPGHTSAILTTQFSPASASRMVSGGGDGTARIWDCETGTPLQTLKGHDSWVLAVAWSPDGKTIATGSYDHTVRVWDATTGQSIAGSNGGPLRGHTKWITALAWEPYHLQVVGRPRLASASKDGGIRIWDVVGGRTDMALTRHTASVTCVKWGGLGTGQIYSTSLDKTVRIWDAREGTLLHTLTAHAHRVNHLAISTDFAIRTGYFDPMSGVPESEKTKHAKALQRFNQASRITGRAVERFATASDDNKIFLWNSSDLTKPTRLDGHQKQVNHVTFSPDGHYVASCGFDNHVILWVAETGKFVKKLIGHVAPVYQCCFSADSRLLVSASKDTTIKAWDVRTGKLVQDLPGHKDEVFAVDWSPDGMRVGSGGKDKMVRIWTH